MTIAKLESFDAIQKTLGHRQAEVLNALAAHPEGLALWQLSMTLSRPMHTLSGRISELVKDGYISDSGRVVRNPASGKAGTVWVKCQPPRIEQMELWK